MTEAEWLACGDPLAMLAFLCVDSDSRKALLLTQACIRRVQGDVSERCFAWGELAGRIANGEGVSDLLNNEWESVESELNALDSRQSSNGGGRFYALLSILVVCAL